MFIVFLTHRRNIYVNTKSNVTFLFLSRTLLYVHASFKYMREIVYQTHTRALFKCMLGTVCQTHRHRLNVYVEPFECMHRTVCQTHS
jgi:hypothetical protein